MRRRTAVPVYLGLELVGSLSFLLALYGRAVRRVAPAMVLPSGR